MRIAVIAITAGGARLGKTLSDRLTGYDFHVSRRYAGQAGGDACCFDPAALRELVASSWRQYDGFVLIMATGIVVRLLAPLLESKETDPAVVVIDDAGRFAVSLLSGHLGGANRLAEECADAIGAVPVITTATDVNGLPSFDMLAKEQGWVIDDVSQVKTLNRLLLDQGKIAIVDPGGESRDWFSGREAILFPETLAEAMNSPAEGVVCVTDRIVPQQNHRAMLVLRPRTLVLGIGCNRGAKADEIRELVARHLAEQRLSIKSVCCVATIADKHDEAGLQEYARFIGVPLRCFTREELRQISFPSPPSEHALSAVGVSGVAEPAALCASGGGELLLKKVKSANVTLAVARCCEGNRAC